MTKYLIFLAFLSPVMLFSQADSLCTDTSGTCNLFLTVNTDCWPEENTWKILNISGETVHQGGPYASQPVQAISKRFWLSSGDYSFVFYDAAGDGLFATQWSGLCEANGNINLQDAGGNVFLDYDGSYNFDSLHVSFTLDESVGIIQQQQSAALNVFPNPSDGRFRISAALQAGSDYQLSAYRPDGKLIRIIESGYLNQGETIIMANLSNLPSGLYLIVLNTNDSFITRKIIIEK